MAAQTLGTFTTKLTSLLGDQNPGGIWTTAQLEEAVKEAVGEAWPHFFIVVKDSTSYTGSALDIENTVQTVAVPAAFLGSTVNGIPPALITGLEARAVYPNGTYGEWFDVIDGVEIDDLTLASPMIRFTDFDYFSFELIIWGARPLAAPAVSTDVIEGQLLTGYMEYLMWQSRALLHASREVAGEQDKYNHGRRLIMAEERVKAIRRRHGKAFPHLTIFHK